MSKENVKSALCEIEQNKHSASVRSLAKKFGVSATTLQHLVNAESRIGAGQATGKGLATRE